MRRLSIILLVWLSAASAVFAYGPPRIREFPAGGTLEFTLEDKIRLPDFWWPRTLLSYPVRFPVPPRADQLRLRDLGDGKEVPFQLSTVNGNSAMVHFLSDLPSGGTRRFELSAAESGAPQTSRVKQTIEGNVMTLDAGTLKVRLPASQSVGGRVPGPILAMDRGTGWIGDSVILSSKRAVQSIVTETVESGPLFITCRVTYRFEGGASYAATIRMVAGYDHVEFFEEIRGLAKEDAVFFENAWAGFHPTHRWIAEYGAQTQAEAARPIDQPGIMIFRGEDPPFSGPGGIENPREELQMQMGITASHGTSGSKEVAFWDTATALGLGLFINDVSKWQDHEYSIWASGDTLRVRFRYADGVLYWRWPLVAGTRSTGLACYEHRPSDAKALSLDQKTRIPRDPDNHILLLRSRYGGLSLNRVKDWVLWYPQTAKRGAPIPNDYRKAKDAADFDRIISESSIVRFSKDTIHPVAAGDLRPQKTLVPVVPEFSRLEPTMSPAERERATALLLLAGYATAGEECGTVQTMLGGHPNLMAGFLYPLMAMPYLFPEHPMAAEWRDRFEKAVELQALFHTRPDVSAWAAQGGRWTENLATYNWAFLEPTLTANAMGVAADGVNRYLTPALALHGQYLVGVVTAPVTSASFAGTAASVPPSTTPLRLYPPMGAHSGRRAVPGTLHEFGQALARYRPLLAEHLMWSGAGTAGTLLHGGTTQPIQGVNPGTNPHLRSGKYTGFGLVMRAAVDTPQEVSVFLQQIDKGPNYRWGFANEGGCGDIYYYADGKSYSGHFQEDAGDRRAQDAMVSSNTGVYKNKNHHSIGMNELTRPFYPLESAQFAELASRGEPDPYGWPEYLRRSVMLVGSDYMIVYDSVTGGANTRFAWNCGPGDEMPFIHPLKGGEMWPTRLITRVRDLESHGVWFESHVHGGDRMTLVTHKAEVKEDKPRKPRGEPADPWTRIRTPMTTDYVFQDQSPLHCDSNGLVFDGTAGVIRAWTNGKTELALFHGTQIGAGGVTLAVDNPELGISAAFTDSGEIAGSFFSHRGGALTLKSPQPGKFYVDGAPASFELPPGEHRWEYTAELPEPMPPVILGTENRPGGAMVHFTTVAAAEEYRLELSRDTGKTWQALGTTKAGQFEIQGLSNGQKVHVRAIAVNRQRESRPAAEYPLYVTDAAPLPPEGLKVVLAEKQATLTWGEVLGASQYCLYRRLTGEPTFQEIFRGPATHYVDPNPEVVPPCAEPGEAANLFTPHGKVYEYAVAAVNGNGEGTKSAFAHTDPTSWRNWYPKTELRFKRQSAYWQPPYVTPKEVPERHYP